MNGWKRTKLFVHVVDTFGASSYPTQKRAFVAQTVKCDNLKSSSTEILNVYRGKATLIPRRLLNLFTKAVQSCPESAPVVTRTAVIRSI
jgi:hypothetical protein